MMRVAINGSWRIGPNSYRAYLGRKSSDVIAVNDLGDQQTMAQLPESDSELRPFGCQDNPWGYRGGSSTSLRDPHRRSRIRERRRVRHEPGRRRSR